MIIALGPLLGLMALCTDTKVDKGNPPPPESSYTITLPPDWSIRTEVDNLEHSLNNFTTLTNSLGSANNDLRKSLDEYLKDPQNEVLASAVEKKMAGWATAVVGSFNSIIVDQDPLVANFNSVGRKLAKFDTYLLDKIKDMRTRVTAEDKERADLERDLIKLSIDIKESSDPQQLKERKKQFATLWRNFNLKSRYVTGYRNSLDGYQGLEKNLGTMAKIFTDLKDKVVDLVANLESERDFLMDNMRLQMDSIRVKKVMHEGIFNGNRAIKNVSEKLARLYVQVDAFTTVHRRINEGLNKFVSSQRVLLDVSHNIDKIGFTDHVPNLDAAIEDFYQRRATAPLVDPPVDDVTAGAPPSSPGSSPGVEPARGLEQANGTPAPRNGSPANKEKP